VKRLHAAHFLVLKGSSTDVADGGGNVGAKVMLRSDVGPSTCAN
jgi:hypothetical protein